MTLTVNYYINRFNRDYKETLKHINPDVTKENYKSKYYIAGKETAEFLAHYFCDSFSRGARYTWGDLAEIQYFFSELAKRYGLTAEFKANGII